MVPTNASGRLSSACRRLAGPFDRRAIHQLAGGIDRHPESVGAPLADRRRSSRARARSGSMILWHAAHTGFARCSSIRSRTEAACRAPRILLERRNVRRRQRRRACPAYFPGSTCRAARATCDWRFEVTSSMLPWPSRPRRASSGTVTRRKSAAVDVRNAVVLRQTLVHERVVGVEQIQHAAVLAQDAFEQHLRFALEGLAQVVVEIRETRANRDWRSSDREVSHWPAKLVTSARAADPRACGGSAARARPDRAACPASPASSSSSSGMLLPQEERQARGEFDIADAIRLAGATLRQAAARTGRRIQDRPGCGAAPSRCQRRNCRYCCAPADRSSSGTRRPCSRRHGGRRAAPGSRRIWRGAAASSSVRRVGTAQTKIRRRLGVSPEPVAL